MRKNILTTNNVGNYKNFYKSYVNDLFKLKVAPKIEEQAKQIDGDIRECIKLEIKTFGSIVKRYGDWAKFVTKEMIIAELPYSENCFFNKALYYRGKFIRGYGIELDI